MSQITIHKITAAVVQLCSTTSFSDNLESIEEQLQNVKPNELDIVVLPECFAMLGASQTSFAAYAQLIMEWMSHTAERLGCWLVGWCFTGTCGRAKSLLRFLSCIQSFRKGSGGIQQNASV